MELWYTEKQTDNLGLSCKIKESLHTEQTAFQHLAIIDTIQYGKMLTLDGLVMTTEKDEFVYHEMISHVALNTHPNPEKVLVIGGGDGGAIREIVKNSKVKKAVLVEIDERVIKTSSEYLPSISCALSGNPKVEVIVEDGIKFVYEHHDEFDVILIDSTDPIGPATGLFSREFYQKVSECLKKDGIMVAQSESPFLHQDLIKEMYRCISGIFPITKLFTVPIPTYPSGYWSFTMGSKRYDPEKIEDKNIPVLDTKYYCAEVHKGAFKLPRFVRDLLR